METNNLTLFYNKNFTQEELEFFLFDIAIIFVEKYFINKLMDNLQYEKDVFRILQKLILKKLLVKFKHKSEICEELSLYLFKRYFKFLFEFISELLLEEIAYSNKNVIEFLKYYSLDTLIIKGIKYKTPQLKEKDGPRWNVISMIGIIKTYLKAQSHVDKIKSDMLLSQESLEKYTINGLSPIEHNQNIAIKSDSLEQKILANSNKVNIIRDSINLENNDEKILSLNKELNVEIEQRLILREDKAQLVKQKIKQTQLSNYDKLKKKIALLQREIKSEYIILEKNQKSYTSIKNSLLIALISKKQEIL